MCNLLPKTIYKVLGQRQQHHTISANHSRNKEIEMMTLGGHARPPSQHVPGEQIA